MLWYNPVSGRRGLTAAIRNSQRNCVGCGDGVELLRHFARRGASRRDHPPIDGPGVAVGRVRCCVPMKVDHASVALQGAKVLQQTPAEIDTRRLTDGAVCYEDQ